MSICQGPDTNIDQSGNHPAAINKLLEETNWDLQAVADKLGIGVGALKKLMSRYGITRREQYN
jgi:DNA-binding NtrC family response regulator